MPLTSVYNIGTASFTAGSKTVTGTGVGWTGAGIREGDNFWADGLIVRVSELVSNTELLLAYDWPGQSRTDREYEIQYTPDAARVLAKSSQLLNDLDQTALNPLKNITPQADRIAYYTGAATAALTALTSKARQLLAFTNNTQILENLGILYQTNRYDTTTNKTLRVNAFGLGATNVEPVTNIDLTSMPTCVMGVAPLTAQGTLPTLTGSLDSILNISISANVNCQIYFSSHSSSPLYYRRSTGTSTWQDWKLIQME